MHTPEEQLFEQALELPQGAERAQFLRNACHGDLKLELRVGQLIAAHESAASILDAPASQPLLQFLADASADACGEVIGPYKLLELIGEGGMGLVYMAEQEQPIRRRVALKIIKPGMDTRQVLARFEAERRALERLEHPGIARVLDAGATPAGRPYFVMELVRGIGITEFCDQAQLGTRERLELFNRVCQAVEYAHQAGIIHRDLKPANILVTLHDGVPVPKIIDFGIAKATSGRLVDQTLFTNFLQMIGTPTYMSPEQAQLTSQDVDARSDVYSLGVLLYELLTGGTPFAQERLRSAGYPEIQRIIREEEPPTPSFRVATLSGEELSTVASRRNVDPRRYAHALRGDLDWLVLRALEKDARRRYASAAELAEDVRRYLSDETVIARPPTTAYRVRKFFRRHRVAVLASTAALIAAVAAVSTYVTLQRAERLRIELTAKQSTAAAQREEQGRRLAYGTDVHQADVAYRRGRTDRVRALLAAHEPQQGDADHRGFEWHYLRRMTQATPRALHGQVANVFHASWSSDSRWMATSSADRTVIVRDTQTGEPVATLSGFPDDVNSTTFSPDNTVLAVAGEEGTISFWNWREERVVSAIRTEKHHAFGVLYTADPDVVVVGETLWANPTANASVWRVSTSERLAYRENQRLLAIDPSGTRLLTRNQNYELQICSAQTLETLLAISPKAGQVDFGAFAPDGQHFATCTSNGTVAWWELGEQCRKLFEVQAVDRGRCVAIAPDGESFAACGDDGVTRIWDTSTFLQQQVLWTERGGCWFCGFSPNGNQFVVCHWGGAVEVYARRELPAENRIVAGLSHGRYLVDYDPARSRLALVAVPGHHVSVISAEDGVEQAQFDVTSAPSISAIAFAPERDALWIGSSTGQVSTLDIATG